MINYKHWLDYTEKLFPVEKNQIDFFTKLSEKYESPAKFLNIDCGPALLCEPLIENGLEVSVTDSYEGFISRLKNNPKISSHLVNPVDISRYLFKQNFNIIYTGNYRLVFLKARELIMKFIFDCKMLLSDGGSLVLDLVNFSKLDFSQPRIDLPSKKSEDYQLYSYILKDSDSVKYYLNQQVVTKQGKSIADVTKEEICPISMETIKNYAKQFNFSSVEFYSDYSKSPLTEDSEKIICVLTK